MVWLLGILLGLIVLIVVGGMNDDRYEARCRACYPIREARS